MGFFSNKVKPKLESDDQLGDEKFLDVDELRHQAKMNKLRERQSRLSRRRDERFAKERRKSEIRETRSSITGMRKEAMEKRIAPVKRFAGGMSKASNRIASNMSKMSSRQSSGASSGGSTFGSMFGSQNQVGDTSGGMFGHRESMVSFGGENKFDMTMGRGGKSQFTFGGNKKGGMGLSMMGSSRSAPSHKRKSTRRKKRRR